MALLDFSREKETRLILRKNACKSSIAERRRGDAEPHYLPQLRKDILEVICKYVQIDRRWSACSWSSGMVIFRFLSLEREPYPKTGRVETLTLLFRPEKTGNALRCRFFNGLNQTAR